MKKQLLNLALILLSINAFSQEGSLDFSFGMGTGFVTTQFSTSNSIDEANSIAIQSDGKIIVSGTSEYLYGDSDFSIARYNSDGTLDSSFDLNGLVKTDISGSSNDVCNSMILQNDGKIVLAGYTGLSSTNLAFVRYLSNGSLDNTFGNNGISVIDLGSIKETVRSIAVQPDSKIVFAGTYDEGVNSLDFLIGRINTNGNLDSTFGINGVLKVTIGSSNDYANTVKIQNDGKILVGGYKYGSNSDFALIRCSQNGILDNTFGSSGIVITDLGNNSENAYSLAIQNDGKILLGGYTNNTSSNDDFALVRYNSNGSLDNTFGNAGVAINNIGYSFSPDRIYSIIITDDNKIIATGKAQSASNNCNIPLVRYNVNGSLDNTFGTSGISLSDQGNIGGNSEERAVAIDIQIDKKIVVAGYDEDGVRFMVSRYIGCTAVQPTASSNSPVNQGATLNLYASTIANATYFWTGPNGFSSNQQNPVVSTNATMAMEGTYSVVATVNDCSSIPETTDVTVNPTTSVNDIADNSKFLIYPNPSSGIINIEFSDINNTTKGSLSVYDNIGKIVFSKKLDFKGNTFNTQLDISNYENGIYFIRIENGGNSVIKSIVKN